MAIGHVSIPHAQRPVAGGTVADNLEVYRYIVEALRDVDYAPAEVADLQKQMDVTRANIAKEEKIVASLQVLTKKLLKDWHDSQGSSGKRLWSKIKHTSEHKDLTPFQATSERAYREALEQEQSCRLRIRVLEGKDAELVQQVKDRQPVLAEHARLRARLDSLFDSVFRATGAAAAYPEQDMAERAFESARAWHRELEPMQQMERTVHNELVRAQNMILETVHHMQVAHRIVMAKASEAAQIEAQRGATAAAMNAVKAYDAARKSKPSLEVVIMPRTVLSDMFRFCGWSAIGRADIERALDEAHLTQEALQSIVERNQDDVDAIEGKTKRALAELLRASELLEAERRRIFDSASSEAASLQALHGRQALQSTSNPQPRQSSDFSCPSDLSRSSPRSSVDTQPTQPPSYSFLGSQKETRLAIQIVNSTVAPGSSSSSAAPRSPPPVYGQPAVFPPISLQRMTTCDSQQSSLSTSSVPTQSIFRAESRNTLDGQPSLPALSPTNTREFESPGTDSHMYSSNTCSSNTYSSKSNITAPSIQPPLHPKSARSMSTTSNESNFASQSIRQRPLPKTPSRTSVADAFVTPRTLPSPVHELPARSPERPRAYTLPTSELVYEPDRPRSQTLPVFVDSPSERIIPAPPEHETEDMAKLRREGERALQEVQRATEVLERIRREMVTRATRGSADSDVLLGGQPQKAILPRRVSQQPPPSYTAQKRDDERGFFYISNGTT